MRSTKSSGISGIVEAVKGEGRTGLVGFVSRLKERIRERESGIGAPFPRNEELGPPRFLLMVMFQRVLQGALWMFTACRPSCRWACQMKGQLCSDSRYGIWYRVLSLRIIVADCRFGCCRQRMGSPDIRRGVFVRFVSTRWRIVRQSSLSCQSLSLPASAGHSYLSRPGQLTFMRQRRRGNRV